MHLMISGIEGLEGYYIQIDLVLVPELDLDSFIQVVFW